MAKRDEPLAPAEQRKLDLEIQKLEHEIEEKRHHARYAAVEADEAERTERDSKAAAYNHRIYHFLGAVNDATVKECMLVLEAWSRATPACEITIIFNSPGGGVISGLALYDALLGLKAKGHKLTTVARGYAASMGGVLLQAGDERLIGPNAHVLIHEVSSGAIGKVSEIEDDLKFTKMLQDRLLGILAARSTLTKQQIKTRWRKTDWWLDADESVELGFADRIA